MANENKDIENAVQTIQARALDPVDKFLLICLLRNGLRVSEICNLQAWQIMDKWTSCLTAQKNGVKRIVNHYEATELAEKYVTQLALQIHNRNRYYYYRQLKGLVPDYSTTRDKHHAVTHAPRYIKAQTVFDTTQDMEATKHAIGNRTAKATSHYLREDQQRLIIKQGVKSPPTGQTTPIKVTKRGVLMLNIR